MTHDPEMRELLKPMIAREVELERAVFRVDRERVLARMAQASAAATEPSARQARARGPRYAALAAAAAVLLAVGATFLSRSETSEHADASAAIEVLVSEGSATQLAGASRTEIPAQQGTHIQATGELATAAGAQARIRTPRGLQIELQGDTRVGLDRLEQATSEMKLVRGSVRCTVPHSLGAGAFQVVAHDVTVIDIGTVFTVSLDTESGATRVVVEQGEVLVRRGADEARIKAPDSWSSIATVAEPGAAPDEVEPQGPVASSPPAKAKAPRASPTLGREALLLRRGLAAERQGLAEEASAIFSDLLARYPESQLAPDARAALARVQARAKP